MTRKYKSHPKSFTKLFMPSSSGHQEKLEIKQPFVNPEIWYEWLELSCKSDIFNQNSDINVLLSHYQQNEAQIKFVKNNPWFLIGIELELCFRITSLVCQYGIFPQQEAILDIARELAEKLEIEKKKQINLSFNVFLEPLKSLKCIIDKAWVANFLFRNPQLYERLDVVITSIGDMQVWIKSCDPSPPENFGSLCNQPQLLDSYPTDYLVDPIQVPIDFPADPIQVPIIPSDTYISSVQQYHRPPLAPPIPFESHPYRYVQSPYLSPDSPNSAILHSQAYLNHMMPKNSPVPVLSVDTHKVNKSPRRQASSQAHQNIPTSKAKHSPTLKQSNLIGKRPSPLAVQPIPVLRAPSISNSSLTTHRHSVPNTPLTPKVSPNSESFSSSRAFPASTNSSSVRAHSASKASSASKTSPIINSALAPRTYFFPKGFSPLKKPSCPKCPSSSSSSSSSVPNASPIPETSSTLNSHTTVNTASTPNTNISPDLFSPSRALLSEVFSTSRPNLASYSPNFCIEKSTEMCVNRWYGALNAVIDSFGIQPNNIYNFCCFNLTASQQERIVVSRNKIGKSEPFDFFESLGGDEPGIPYMNSESYRLSVFETISANGSVLPPAIISPVDFTFQNAHVMAMPKETTSWPVPTHSLKISRSNYLMWLTQHFDPLTRASSSSSELVDSGSSNSNSKNKDKDRSSENQHNWRILIAEESLSLDLSFFLEAFQRRILVVVVPEKIDHAVHPFDAGRLVTVTHNKLTNKLAELFQKAGIKLRFKSLLSSSSSSFFSEPLYATVPRLPTDVKSSLPGYISSYSSYFSSKIKLSLANCLFPSRLAQIYLGLRINSVEANNAWKVSGIVPRNPDCVLTKFTPESDVLHSQVLLDVSPTKKTGYTYFSNPGIYSSIGSKASTSKAGSQGLKNDAAAPASTCKASKSDKGKRPIANSASSDCEKSSQQEFIFQSEQIIHRFLQQFSCPEPIVLKNGTINYRPKLIKQVFVSTAPTATVDDDTTTTSKTTVTEGPRLFHNDCGKNFGTCDNRKGPSDGDDVDNDNCYGNCEIDNNTGMQDLLEDLLDDDRVMLLTIGQYMYPSQLGEKGSIIAIDEIVNSLEPYLDGV